MMKISSHSWDISNPEKLYKQFQLTPNKGKDSARQSSKSENNILEKSPNGAMTAIDVLSDREIQTLQLLFGYNQEGNSSFYGKSQTKSIQSGFLLDVKG